MIASTAGQTMLKLIAKRIEFDTASSPPATFGIHILSSRLLPCLKLNALGYMLRAIRRAAKHDNHYR